MMQRTKDWILRNGPLFLLCLPVLGLCAAAMYTATPKQPEYTLVVNSKSRVRPGIRDGIVDCYADDLERCMRSMGADICGPGERFEILRPLEYRRDGTPVVRWKCVVDVERRPV